MSNRCLSSVFQHSAAKGSARLVLLAMADEANDQGLLTAYRRSQSWIAAKANVDRASVRRAIQTLEDLGELVVLVRGDGRESSDYQIVLPDLASIEGVQVAPPAVAARTRRERTVQPQGVQDAPPIIPVSPCGTPSTPEISSSDDDERTSEIEDLCTLLADRIEQFGGTRPKISKRWRNDMRLLVRTGPLHVAHVGPLSVEQTRALIATVFDELNEPNGRGGFCWAGVIQSPGALREHYKGVKQAWRILHMSQNSRGTQMVDKVARRLAGDVSSSREHEPLGLLAALEEPKEMNA